MRVLAAQRRQNPARLGREPIISDSQSRCDRSCLFPLWINALAHREPDSGTTTIDGNRFHDPHGKPRCFFLASMFVRLDSDVLVLYVRSSHCPRGETSLG